MLVARLIVAKKMHTPVYLNEAINALDIKKDGTYIDATLGEGGHLDEIRKRGGRVLAIDWDKEQIANYEPRIKNDKNIILAHGNFADIETIAKQNGFTDVDGILFDLGLSYSQLSKKQIGLSYKQYDEPLDMRLNPAEEHTAADILNLMSEEDLYKTFAQNAEELYSKQLATACVNRRKHYKFATVGDFIDVIDHVIPDNPQKSYARLFQALRIEVNDEFNNLKKGLLGGLHVLKSRGRVVVISFHSVEDRMVKRFIQSDEELIEESYKILKKNSKKFERSALLRVIVKK